ncbi:MAG: hypothetical protein J7501_10310 [Bdellovibrio sp.]|nr:hypothetical protein [Bdellovibrio sp.]
MSKKNAVILVIVAAVILILSYCFLKPNHSADVFPADMPPAEGVPAGDTNPTPPPADNETSPVQADEAGFLPTKMEDPERFAMLQKSFKDLGACLAVQTGPFGQNDDINFESLNTVVAPDLGEVVTQQEKWSTTDIKTNAGEIRRIFIENTNDPDMPVARVLKYYSLIPTGGQKELPLAREQSLNPSDTLIASLESDGQLVSKSIARTVLYQNGDDLNVVERNGKIYSFTLSHEGKTFNCTGVDSSKTLKCVCK